MESSDIDELLEEAVKVALQYEKVTSSLFQRRLAIGYARAARILDQLEYFKIVEKVDGYNKPRKVLIHSFEEFKQMNIKKNVSVENTNQVDENVFNIKETEIFPKFSQYTLYLTSILIVIGLFRIENHDIKILYSLGMLIASSVSKYGTNISYYTTKHPKDVNNILDRWWPYVLVWLFGMYGLIS